MLVDRAVQLKSKVRKGEEYKGSVEEFQHKFRSTLTFAISRRQDSSANSAQNSSRNTSLDRRYTRMHDHLKPNRVCWDDEVEVILKF